MKNIHILQTDKPSRLGYLTKKGKEVFNDLRLFEKPMPNILDSENQNIYITSNEEIKEGDWVIKISSLYKGGGNIQKYSFIDKHFKDITFKKIILTTDTDLIEDGVQKIDDEFLEWFVKNPSCEEVDVKPMLSNNGRVFYGYKIFIPKEEPKQETLEETYNKWSLEEAQKFALSKFKYGNHKKGYITIELILEVLKVGVLTGHKFGAKWQQERMYSEEDMIEFGFSTYCYISELMGVPFNLISENRLNAEEWFEHFKNK